MDLYPFQFRPTFRQYVWGGRRLGTTLGKPIGEADRYAESWEVVDHGDDQSVVANGPLVGTTLNKLVRDYGKELFGTSLDLETPLERFPLLFKFLDANRDLSVQVHPNDAQAALLDPPDLGKTEAWYVIDAAPGSRIYVGLKQGVDRAKLKAACETGNIDSALHSFEPKPGDCVMIPAGTVHAIGAGLLVAEIQQSSDTTYRLFDWNRVDTNGRPRQLHMEQALDATEFGIGPPDPVAPIKCEEPHRRNLVTCDKFVLDRIGSDDECLIGGDNRFHIVVAIKGDAVLQGKNGTETSLSFGNTVLVPASVGGVRVRPSTFTSTPHVLLDAYLP